MARTSAKSKNSASAPQKLAPASFINLFFANLLPDDLANLSRNERNLLASSIYQFSKKRAAGETLIRVFNPSVEKDGWSVDHTVLEVINDDMPFIVDSVTGELQRRGLTMHLAIHPMFQTKRDSKGNCVAIEAAERDADVPKGYAMESFLHVHFDRCIDEKQLKDIEQSVREVLADAAAAVEDWGAMRARAIECAADIAATRYDGMSAEEAEEIRAFLTWLSNDNFTFLGYRELEPFGQAGQTYWHTIPKTGLGILRNDKTTVFGGLRDINKQPQEIQKFMRQKRVMIVTKTNLRSRVHRTSPMDAVFVRHINDKGEVVGEHLFIGLFTSASYIQTPRQIPYLRDKVRKVLERANFVPQSHDGKALIHVIDTYPRDELFQIGIEDLYRHAVGVVQLQERARVALFLRRDPFGRFATCLLYIPRERYDFSLRQRIEAKLESAFAGKISDFNLRIDDSPLAQIFITITLPTESSKPDHNRLEDELREICRAWPDLLRTTLSQAYGESTGLTLLRRYQNAFPAAYYDEIPATDALSDIENLERVRTTCRLVVAITHDEQSGYRLKLFQPGRHLVLSDMLPLIENMGLKVQYMSGPHAITPGDSGLKIYLHEFVGTSAHLSIASFKSIQTVFEECFAQIWSGDVENDRFNTLVLRAGLQTREVIMLRAMARYLRQLRIPYSHDMMADVLIAHPGVTQNLVRLFNARFNPDLRGDRKKLMAMQEAEILSALGAIQALEEDRIIRRYLNLMQSCLRTNYYQLDEEGKAKPYLSLKFDSRVIEYMPLPKPMMEIFVYSPRVEAVHLRGGKVARGGIRWSDRREDFRNEILGLMKAQMVKNSVIVPVGSKGGFIVKRPPAEADKFQTEGIACYSTMMQGLLDITDNRVNGKIVPPIRVVRHDGDDPYLVVAADKGTAKFSDIANGIAQKNGFWLDDAFASGGSVGYDHKHMGITARGAWEAVKRHFREIGKDIQTTDFTCIGVGDMSGDVFGNGMLLSRHIRLLGAFDHRHIFCDPNPDATQSFAERQRLFELPRSSWADYDSKKLSKGGAIYARNEKTLKLTPEIRKTFGLTSDTVTPAELMQAMLRAEVELLYFGGIGTYVKSTEESHEEASDRANEAIRINGEELRAQVVGEGANLGLTQRGRIEYAMQGGRLNTDAIDNSAGVDTSDHEVNIKILLRKLVQNGTLTLPARNKLLASMTDEVGHLVLRDNYRQTQALSIAESQASALLTLHRRTMRTLEKSGLLNRAVEFLPDEGELSERQREDKGLTRPELAVLLSYAKIWLYEQILKSDLPDDEFLRGDLLRYFPEPLQRKYANEISQHQLEREIVATDLTNGIVNKSGCHFVMEMMEQTGCDAVAVARAYILSRAAYHIPALWRDVEALDNRVVTSVQIDMLRKINEMRDYAVTWFLTENETGGKLAANVELYRNGVERLSDWLSKASDAIKQEAVSIEQKLTAHAVPKVLAQKIGALPYLAIAPELTRLAKGADCSIERTADIFFGLGTRLNLGWLRELSQKLTLHNHWQREAIAMIMNSIAANQRQLAAKIIGRKPGKNGKASRNTTGAEQLTVWSEANRPALERYDALINELRTVGTIDLAMLTLVNHHLANLAA